MLSKLVESLVGASARVDALQRRLCGDDAAREGRPRQVVGAAGHLGAAGALDALDAVRVDDAAAAAPQTAAAAFVLGVLEHGRGAGEREEYKQPLQTVEHHEHHPESGRVQESG